MTERWELDVEEGKKIIVEIEGGTLNYCPLDSTPARDTAMSQAVQSAVREFEATRRAGERLGELVIERDCGSGHRWRRRVQL